MLNAIQQVSKSDSRLAKLFVDAKEYSQIRLNFFSARKSDATDQRCSKSVNTAV